MAFSTKATVRSRTFRSAVGCGVSACVHLGLIVLAPSAMEARRGGSGDVLSLTIEEEDKDLPGSPPAASETKGAGSRSAMARRIPTTPRRSFRRRGRRLGDTTLSSPTGMVMETPESAAPEHRPPRLPLFTGPPRPAAPVESGPVDGQPSASEGPPLLSAFTVPAPLLLREGEEASPDHRGGAEGEREAAPALRGEAGFPEPGSGQGTFDFYSPFDYKKEMKKARKKVDGERMSREMHKNSNRGYGVVCNTGRGWFLCREKGLEACNRKHDNLCRYAEKKEAEELTRDRFW